MQTRITQKGQIVIPAKLRKKYGIETGTQFRIDDDNGKLILTPITSDYIHSMRGMLKPGKNMKSALETLKSERKTDRLREDETFGV